MKCEFMNIQWCMHGSAIRGLESRLWLEVHLKAEPRCRSGIRMKVCELNKNAFEPYAGQQNLMFAKRWKVAILPKRQSTVNSYCGQSSNDYKYNVSILDPRRYPTSYCSSYTPTYVFYELTAFCRNEFSRNWTSGFGVRLSSQCTVVGEMPCHRNRIRKVRLTQLTLSNIVMTWQQTHV